VTCPDLGDGFTLPVEPDDESLSQPGEGTTVNFSISVRVP
jgi:hypothetical protein